MVGNTLLLLLVFLLVMAVSYLLYQSMRRPRTFELPEDTYEMKYLVRIVAEIFAERQSAGNLDKNVSRQEYENMEKRRMELREALRKASYGDMEARDYIILSIRDMMKSSAGSRSFPEINEQTINRVIPFENSKELSGRDRFEIIMHLYKKKYEQEALQAFIEDFQLTKPMYTVSGEVYYEITSLQIREIYQQVMEGYPLKYDDKLDIVARRIFAEYKGFGAVDLLFEFSIDEIDCGVSGIPKDAYEIAVREESDRMIGGLSTIQYSYKSIWIMLSALKIHLSFLEFESQKALIRVCQNIYKYDASEMLSRKKGYVISTMIGGSRIVVVRPPMASSWAFFARKFDSVSSIAPEKLLRDPDSILPIIMMKWLIRGYQNMVISGAMGTGKTTFLKSMIRFLPADLAIRVYEASAELNLQYTYTRRNILALQETESIGMQEELDLGMKLNSDVTILGEMASQESVAWYVQSARKGSKLAIGTIHTKTAEALISYMRDSLPGYSNERAAEEAAIAACHIDCHLEKEKDHRYLERITQIVPITDRRYPSQILEIAEGKTLEELHYLDSMEKAHRETDRQLFEARDLIRFDLEKNRYVLVNLPTKQMLQDIRNVLTPQEEQEFLRDMERLKLISMGGVAAS